MTMQSARKRTGMTQEQAAERAGIPLSTFRKWEQGVYRPPIDKVILLADLYGCTTDEILGSQFDPSLHESDIESGSVAPGSTQLAPDEEVLVDYYRQCTDAQRSSILMMAQAFASMTSKGSAPVSDASNL